MMNDTLSMADLKKKKKNRNNSLTELVILLKYHGWTYDDSQISALGTLSGLKKMFKDLSRAQEA